jgi:hypothetical protein
MKIRYDENGVICCFGTSDRIDAPEWEGTIPPDFETFAYLGKYKVENGVIVEVGGWVEPTFSDSDPFKELAPE